MNLGTLGKILVLAVAAVAIAATDRAVTKERAAYAGFLAPAEMALPGYLEPAEEPLFGTRLIRITRPGDMGSGVVCMKKYCSHRYSSAQAWNADQSLLVISNGCNGLCFLDGDTFQPRFRRDQAAECEWNPVDSDSMICVSDTAIFTWWPRRDRRLKVASFPGYKELGFGPNKGNPSDDGSRIAVRATHHGRMVVFAYDLPGRKKFPDIDLTRLPGTNNACTISPLGGNILCLQDQSDGTEQTYIYAVDGTPGQVWKENHRPGHGDLTVDVDGSEIYVGISKSPPDKYQIIKRRLADGAVTSLMAYGEAQHVSLRAIRRPGWAIVSYGGDPADVARHAEWAPYAREVIALKLDGSGQVRRIAQTHNVPSDYWSETHGSPSPDGSRIIWSSNWGTPGGPVFEFVSNLEWPDDPTPQGGHSNALN